MPNSEDFPAPLGPAGLDIKVEPFGHHHRAEALREARDFQDRRH
jgi:hypothetical protein